LEFIACSSFPHGDATIAIFLTPASVNSKRRLHRIAIDIASSSSFFVQVEPRWLELFSLPSISSSLGSATQSLHYHDGQ
jgi:hypothetical protein